MADEWQQELMRFAKKYSLIIHPSVSYEATGRHNGDLPENGLSEGKSVRLEDIARETHEDLIRGESIPGFLQ
jgi:hypothetical protein